MSTEDNNTSYQNSLKTKILSGFICISNTNFYDLDAQYQCFEIVFTQQKPTKW